MSGRLVPRLTLAALGVVLALFAVISVGGVVRGLDHADEAARAGDLVQAYLRTQDALSVEDQVEDVYTEGRPGAKGPLLRERFDTAATTLDAALRQIAREGGAGDRRLASEALPLHTEYVSAMRDIFAALDAGDEELAEEINDERADDAQDALQPLLSGSGPDYAIAQLRELDELRAAQRDELRATIVVVIAGTVAYVLVLVLFAAFQRRLDRATATELAHLRDSLLRDPLTGLANHRAFHDDLEALLAGPGEAHALVLVDLVGLKALNDARGHLAGDERLQLVGEALAATAGAEGRAYRLGSDEFAVVLPHAGVWRGVQLAEAVHGRVPHGAVRAGVADAPGATGRTELTRRADLALLTARRAGRAVVVHSADLEERTGEEAEEAGGLRALTRALAEAVDAKDSYTRSHCETVSTVAALVAEELGLAPRRVAQVRLAGLLHDVGKIGIPDAVLNKPGPLDLAEWEVMRSHARLGADILAAAGLEEEAYWVLHHHERLDGAGYPDRLAGEEVPLESRIILCSDTFEAITSDRPYRRGRPEADALVELRRHAGTQFDPECVEALARVLGRSRALRAVAA